jgi:hypothetical protein
LLAITCTANKSLRQTTVDCRVGSPMILFRCWYCNKTYSVAERRVGERLTCTCRQLLRVPARSGGNSRVRTVTDWLVEATVYGGGGTLLGGGLGVLTLGRVVGLRRGWLLIAGLAAAGFLAGVFGGERGVNWVGRMIRERKNR